jgi:hypothetical protein
MKEKKMESYLREKEKEVRPKNFMHSKKGETSDPVHSVKITAKERERHAPCEENRHEAFQLGTNPMAMTQFEKELVHKEKEERRHANDNYVAGIQGRDGGRFPREQFDDRWPDKF